MVENFREEKEYILRILVSKPEPLLYLVDYKV